VFTPACPQRGLPASCRLDSQPGGRSRPDGGANRFRIEADRGLASESFTGRGLQTGITRLSAMHPAIATPRFPFFSPARPRPASEAGPSSASRYSRHERTVVYP
jgi:hypothetical protein